MIQHENQDSPRRLDPLRRSAAPVATTQSDHPTTMKIISLLRMFPLLPESPYSPAPGPTSCPSYLTHSLSGFLRVLRTWHPIILTSKTLIATFKGGLRFGATFLLVGLLASGETLVTTAADDPVIVLQRRALPMEGG
jgi:hypothetical protein